MKTKLWRKQKLPSICQGRWASNFLEVYFENKAETMLLYIPQHYKSLPCRENKYRQARAGLLSAMLTCCQELVSIVCKFSQFSYLPSHELRDIRPAFTFYYESLSDLNFMISVVGLAGVAPLPLAVSAHGPACRAQLGLHFTLTMGFPVTSRATPRVSRVSRGSRGFPNRIIPWGRPYCHFWTQRYF